MSSANEPLIKGLSNTQSLKDLKTSELDHKFSTLRQEVQDFFTSKAVTLPVQARCMYLSTSLRKIFVYSPGSITVYSIATNSIEKHVEIPINDALSLTGNSQGLFLGTADAQLYHLSYDFEILKTVTIGKRYLYVQAIGDSKVWAVSYGYTVYCYVIETEQVYRLASFPWGEGISVSPSEEYITAFSSQELKVYSSAYQYIEYHWSTENEIKNVDFSKDSKLMLAALSTGFTLWQTETWTQTRTISVAKTNYAKFYGRGSYIVHSYESKISVWNPSSAVQEQEFVYYTDHTNVNCIIIDELENLAYLINGTDNIVLHELPSCNVLEIEYQPQPVYEEYYQEEGDEEEREVEAPVALVPICISTHSAFGVFYKNGCLNKLSFETLKTEKVSLEQFPDETIHYLSVDGSFIYELSSTNISKIQLESYKVVKTLPLSLDLSSVAFISEVGTLLAVSSTYTLHIINFSSGITRLINVGDQITSIIEINSKILVSVLNQIGYLASDDTVKLIDPTGASPVIKLLISNKDELVQVSRDDIRFWEPSALQELTVFKSPYPIECVYQSESRTLVFISSGTQIFGFFLNDFVEFYRIDIGTPIKSLHLAAREKFIIAVTHEWTLRRVINQVEGKFSIVASNIDAEQIVKCVSGTLETYDPRLEKWFIFPHGINALHCFGYFNNHEYLKKAFENDTPYLTSDLGDPLSIVLSKNYRECVDSILSCLRKRVGNNLYALRSLDDKLPELNRGSYKGLDELYECCFVQDTTSNLARFCSESTDLPKERFSNVITIAPFLTAADTENKTVRVEYYTTTLAVSFKVGSKESIDFLRSLQECENNEIFKTRFIQLVLRKKWELTYSFIVMHSSLYFTYMVCLALYIVMGWAPCFYVCFVVNVFLLVYEGIQMLSDIVEYVKDIWNYVDISRAVIVFVYAAFLYFGSEDESWLFALTVLSALRGITLFRLFSNTRYMISLLTEVFKSLIAFSCVLLYATVCFALLTRVIDKDTEFFVILAKTFQLEIGAFDVKDTGGPLSWIVFLGSTMIGLVIMMNLLISLLGDTYSSVQEASEIEDQRQLIELILEVENLCFWNKGSTGRQFIQICDMFRVADVGAGIEKKLLKIKSINLNLVKLVSSLTTSKKHSELHKKVVKKIEARMKSNNKEVLNVLVDLKKTVQQLQGAPEKQEETAYVPVCLKGHYLTEAPRNFAFCDLCKKFVGTLSLCCEDCNFDMCPTCVEWNKNNPEFPGSLCTKGHVMRESKNETVQGEGEVSLTYKCRCCNQDATDEVIYYCRYCDYGMCVACKNVVVKSSSIISKTKCPKLHVLIWNTTSLYSELSNVLSCSNCFTKYLGAGMFACTSCEYWLCIKCFKTKYI